MGGNVPGWHADMSQSKDELERQLSQARKTGLCDQQKEVTSAAYPFNSVLGLYGGLSWVVNQSYRGEGYPDHSSMQEGTASRVCITPPISQIIGMMTATLPAIHRTPLLYQRLKNQISQSFEATVTMNQEVFLELDWWSSRTNLLAGRKIQKPEMVIETDASMMVTFREQEPHKLLGTSSSHLCSKILCQACKECSHPDKDGQQNSHLLCESQRRDSLSKIEAI